MSLANTLKKLRHQYNFTQEFIAKKLGITRQTYSAIEQGLRTPNILEMQKLADIYNLSIEQILKGQITPKAKVILPNANKNAKNRKLNRKLKNATKRSSPHEPTIRISVPQQKLDLFKEVLLYILTKIGAKPNIGESVINKILYFIDFDYYEKYEEQLIGAKYLKNHFGPTPVELPDILKQMQNNKEIILIPSKYFGHNQRKYLPNRDPNLEKLTAQAKAHIDWEIERFKDFNAAKISEYSHGDVPYIGTEDGHIIDYEAVFYRTPEYSVRQE